MCGQLIGRAVDLVGSGPWYVDATSHEGQTVRDAAGSSGTWVRVAAGCTHGAQVSSDAPSVAAAHEEIRAKDGNAVAVFVTPRQPGTAVITAVVGTHAPTTITFVVGSTAR